MTTRTGKQIIGTLATELISTGYNLPPKCHFQPCSDGNGFAESSKSCIKYIQESQQSADALYYYTIRSLHE